MGQLEIRTEKIDLGNYGVFKATSGNIAKQWKIKQETHRTIRAEKLVEAVMKKIATQKLQTKKEKMRD